MGGCHHFSHHKIEQEQLINVYPPLYIGIHLSSPHRPLNALSLILVKMKDHQAFPSWSVSPSMDKTILLLSFSLKPELRLVSILSYPIPGLSLVSCKLLYLSAVAGIEDEMMTMMCMYGTQVVRWLL